MSRRASASIQVELNRNFASSRPARIAGVALAVLLVACSSVESEIRDVIGKDLAAKGNCLDHKFPVTVQVGSGLFGTRADLLNEYQALDRAGVIRSVSQQPRMMAGGVRINEVRLDLTDAGRKSLRDGRLCYGRSEVVKVIDYTDGKAPDGTRLVKARVLLKHHIDAEWARDPVFKNQVESGEEQSEYALVKTNNGWRKVF
jgi:hypothetical protein